MSALSIYIDDPVPLTRTKKPKLVADLFCGAGGFSTGAQRALDELGMPMSLVCVNHWQRSIQTNQANHPSAVHFCQDLSSLRPIIAVPGGRLDLLMASPACTFHSRARGGKPTSDQQRMDPWHVVTWMTELRVVRLIVENVPEFQFWGPIDIRTGRPVKSRRSEYFSAWCNVIRGLGFKLEWRVLNCADYGDATTRERLFLIARSDGKRLSWPQPSHSKTGNGDLFGGSQGWRPAREIIDWSLPGKSIYTRKKPLAPATIRRIYSGITRFGFPEPYIVVLRQHMAERSIDLPVPTIAANGGHIGLAQPVLVNLQPASAPTPFILSQASCGAPRPVSAPVPTITTGGAGGAHALISPYYGGGSGLTCASAAEPLPTVTTKGRFGLVVPITHADGSNRARSLEQPLPTLTTANRGEQAFVQLDDGGQQWDILFRMLQPHELAAAMGFDRPGAERYAFAGNKTEITKQIGNAVPVGTATALVRAMMAE